MKKVTVFETADGKRFDVHADALRHLDKVYGDKLCEITRALVQFDGKYNKMLEWLDKNLEAFQPLLGIKADMKLLGGEDHE